MERPTKIAHVCSRWHRVEIKSSKICGCFYCTTVFEPDQILEWVDDGETALCPNCRIDAVLGDGSSFPITIAFLSRMKKRWF